MTAKCQGGEGLSRGAGYRVIYADTGKKGIEAAIKERPLLAVLDLMLPDISGEEVCQELRQIGDFPIIMLTAKASEEERVAALHLEQMIMSSSPSVHASLCIASRPCCGAAKGDLDHAEPSVSTRALL